MESFSKILQLSDLNDFINISQDCIKPINAKKIDSIDKLKINHISLSKPSISIDDCLACKGCVTSVDTVLLEHQRAEDFINILIANNEALRPKLIVMTISPQSLASLASNYNTSMTEIKDQLESFFKCRGVDIFLETSLMREISLLESGKEFVKRYKEKLNQLPILSSSCPGWICYAEKVQGEQILPNISAIRSQLQIAGSFVKKYLFKEVMEETKGNDKLGLYHVSVMPCYDRKLEAIRKEFKLAETENLVDQVITTAELLYLYENPILIEPYNKRNIKDNLISNKYLWPYIIRDNSESDGYLYFVANYAAKQLFNCDTATFKVTNFKNENMQEIIIDTGPTNEPLLFAKAYGFKNIQILLQNIKRKRKKYHYIEIMACPSGCLNGGGQIKINDDSNEAFKTIQNTYNMTNKRDVYDGSEQLEIIYRDWLCTDTTIIDNIYTSYSATSKTIVSITNQW